MRLIIDHIKMIGMTDEELDAGTPAYKGGEGELEPSARSAF